MNTVSIPVRPFHMASLSLQRKLSILVCLVVFGDWLLFSHIPGISIALFCLVLGAGILAANIERLRIGNLFISLAVLALSVLPIVEELNPLSLSLAFAGIMFFSLHLVDRTTGRILTSLRYMMQLTLLGLFRLFGDIILSFRIGSRRNDGTGSGHSLTNWVLPAAFGIVFLALFTSANPLLANWLMNFEHLTINLLSGISSERIIFWTVTSVVLWPFIRLRLRNRERTNTIWSLTDQEQNDLSGFMARFINRHSILRSLILFNFMFALQSVLDITYLWGGVSLPQGMSHADYAHRGAYPLIATALLAAVFVLITLRPGSDTEKSPAIRFLVYCWIAQNILLVISSILRLDLYINVYQLTYLRVAAFIWMGLVAAGLALIILRIAMNRSNGWLVAANLTTLGITLYACGFINFGHLIASWNVSNRNVAGIDIGYLCSLGEPAIPSIDRLYNEYRYAGTNQSDQARLNICRNRHILSHNQAMAKWRSWSARSQRLSTYLQPHNNANAAKSDAP